MANEQDVVSIDDARPLTRADVARVLGVSLSTVRRWQRQGRIASTKGADGVHQFRPADVAALRETLAVEAKGAPEKKASSAKRRAPELGRWSGRTAGELTGQLLAAFEKRWALSEIASTYDVEIRVVRRHYSDWLLGLDRYEQEKGERGAWRPSEAKEFPAATRNALLAVAEHLDEPVRISVARFDEWTGPAPEYAPYDGLCWLPGFETTRPVELGELWSRYGEGAFVVHAFAADGSRLWEMKLRVQASHAVSSERLRPSGD